MTKYLALVICLVATGCSLPAVVPVAGAALGAADVTIFHGCVGVQMANAMPWNLNDPYGCVPVRYILPDAPQGIHQIIP